MMQRGFTLIELGIVLGVMSILIAVSLPSFVELAQNQMAKEAANQVEEILEGARVYYHNSYIVESLFPHEAHWPDENAGGCNLITAGGGDSLGKLATFMSKPPVLLKKNSWGHNLQVRLTASGGALNSCSYDVSTEIPDELLGIIDTYLPQVRCDGSCFGPDIAGVTTRCCAAITEPALESALACALFEATGTGLACP